MDGKIIIETKGKLANGNVLVCENGKARAMDVHALLPDLRGCGESGGAYIGMGWPDRKDMLHWIDWIIRRDSGAQIVLYGISMGGATVMMTAGEELPEQVKGYPSYSVPYHDVYWYGNDPAGS